MIRAGPPSYTRPDVEKTHVVVSADVIGEHERVSTCGDAPEFALVLIWICGVPPTRPPTSPVTKKLQFAPLAEFRQLPLIENSSGFVGGVVVGVLVGVPEGVGVGVPGRKVL